MRSYYLYPITQDIEDTNNYSQKNNNNLSTIHTSSNKNYTESKNNPKEPTSKLLITKSQHTQLISLLTQRRFPIEEIRIVINERYKVNESKYLNNEQANDFIEFLKLYNSI